MKKRIFIIAAISFIALLAIASLHLKNKEGAGEKKESGGLQIRGKIAIVIDDWGYNNRYIDMLFDIKRPLTVSILPHLRYSREITERIRAGSRLCDVILHLPLESKSGRAAERDTIRCNMPEGEIVRRVDEALESVPGAIGVSNHQGSKATEDKRVMRSILGELKKKRLFFLDSITTPNSVCSGIARELGVKFAKRDVFIDITDRTDKEQFESYIKKQLAELEGVALRNGSAIGIGHNRPETLTVLKEIIPIMEKDGIEIVPLKELVN